VGHGESSDGTWAQLEEAAQAGLKREEVALPPLRPVVNVDDPLLELAQMQVLRLAAAEMGIQEDPTWESTEAALGDQLLRDADGNLPPPPPRSQFPAPPPPPAPPTN
jgi:hypothetical protein